MLVTRMAQSGCTGVFVGFESLNEDSMIYTGKRTPMPSDYARRVSIFHSVGIQINGSFVLGFDHDKPDVFEKTIAWIEDASLSQRTSRFSHRTLAHRFSHKWSLRVDCLSRLSLYDTGHVVFQPKRMSFSGASERL